MKTHITLCFAIIAFLSSCDLNILEERPTGFTSPSNFYRNSDDAFIALNGVYSSLLGLYNSNTGFGTLYGAHGADIVIHRPGHPILAGVGSYTITSQDNFISGLWSGLYGMINRANSVIDRVPGIEMEQVEKDQVIGEALFLRALAYFNLVRAWGSVPLLVHETTDLNDLNLSRTASSIVYQQIIDDLLMAADLLPDEIDNQRATVGSAKVLLGKVYLQMAGFPLQDTPKYAEAANILKEVIDADQYVLLGNYSDVFDINNEDNNEIIFAVQFTDGGIGQGSSYGRIYGPLGNFSTGGAIDYHSINTEFALSYDPVNDERFHHNICTFSFTTGLEYAAPVQGNGWRPWKWHKPNPVPYGQSDTPQDYPILRYSDVLLMYAEALNGVNNGPTTEAYNAIDAVRNRAGLADLATGMTSSQFIDALLQERAWELCYEGHRRPDLIRTGKLIERVRAIPTDTQYYKPYSAADNIQEFHLVWPIPQREMDLNSNLEQNSNY